MKLTRHRGIIDSQSVKSTETSDGRGCDTGKEVNGRKRHILTAHTGSEAGPRVTEPMPQERWVGVPPQEPVA